MNESGSGKAKSVEQLLSDLRQHDWSVNWRTADALAEMGEHAFLHLLRALEDPDGYVRNGAAIALGKIGNGDAAQPLIRALQWRDERVYGDDEDQEARTSAASATPLLFQIVEAPNEDKYVRCHAAQALGRIGGSPKILPVLLAMLEASEEEVRNGALYGLGALHDSRAFNAIVEQLDSERHRYAAIMALGELGDPRACELLIPMLKSRDDSVSSHAATALGKIGCHGALPSLIHLRDRMAASDSAISRAHRVTVEGVIQKLQERQHESGPD